MDGHVVLTQGPIVHLRPWDDCISFSELSIDNLPPFHVRLRDDQVGHLSRWAYKNCGRFPSLKLRQYWPADFTFDGHAIYSYRVSWGQGFVAVDCKGREKKLVGRITLPNYEDPCLPPTYTSSGELMRKETGLSRASPATKRGATGMDRDEADHESKKARVSSDDSADGKVQGSSTSDSKTPTGSERSRDEVFQTLVTKIDSMVDERNEMKVTVQRLEVEISGAKASSAEDKETITDYEETIDRRAQEIVALKESVAAGERRYRSTLKLYLTKQGDCGAHEKTISRLREECESHRQSSAQLERIKTEIEAHAKALTELGNQ